MERDLIDSVEFWEDLFHNETPSLDPDGLNCFTLPSNYFKRIYGTKEAKTYDINVKSIILNSYMTNSINRNSISEVMNASFIEVSIDDIKPLDIFFYYIMRPNKGLVPHTELYVGNNKTIDVLDEIILTDIPKKYNKIYRLKDSR